MPNDFVLKPDAALEQAIAKCQSAEEIREVTHRYLQEHGVIERARDGSEREIDSPPQQLTGGVSLPANGQYKLERELKFDP